jgi:DNA gyrase subunit B
LGGRAARTVLFGDIPAFPASDPSGEIAVAYRWTTGTTDEIHSFVNGIATPAGGMHVEGFKKALTDVINKYARPYVADPLRDVLLGSDVREGLTAAISVTVDNPQFGPKGAFENLGIRRLVERTTTEQVEQWISRNPNEAELVRQKAMAARHWRQDQ